jgi:hypothetical protein
MLSFRITDLAKALPPSPAENAITNIGEIANYLKVTK